MRSYIERKKLHDLMDIISLVICGIVSGAEGWEAIEEFGHEGNAPINRVSMEQFIVFIIFLLAVALWIGALPKLYMHHE